MLELSPNKICHLCGKNFQDYQTKEVLKIAWEIHCLIVHEVETLESEGVNMSDSDSEKSRYYFDHTFNLNVFFFKVEFQPPFPRIAHCTSD